MRFTFLILIYIITILGCDRSSHKTASYSLRDSIVQKNFKEIDSLDYFDTTDINYKILKAYILNDTDFFRKLSTSIDDERKFKQQWSTLDSCIHQPNLQDMNAEVAYRFIYRAAFCPFTLNITITKDRDNINLHLMLYQFNWDTASCRIINEYDKKLTLKNWEDIVEVVRTSDFWGLKRENGIHGVDGDNITVIGYERGDTSYNRPSKFNYVDRWNLHWSTLADPFDLVLKFSGNKQGCVWVE